MAVYLGSERVGVTLVKQGTGGSGIKYASGKVTSDENGVVTFPQLDFTPTMIIVWNVELLDWAEIDGVDPSEWPEDMVRYTHNGVMLFAINIDGRWVSQGVSDTSGGVYITNESADGGTREFFPTYSSSGVSINNDIYSYQLGRFSGRNLDEIAEVEFNYAIYG